jgi:hypothetical protein
LEQIWDTAGWPLRAGISVWRPYESFGIERQETMLEAAATAVDLISTGRIVAPGGLGQLLSVQCHQPVSDGDQPRAADMVRTARIEALRQSGAKAQREFDDWFATARTDPAVARRIFGIFSHYSRTREAYDAERAFMIRHGIPAGFLPDPEPGRFIESWTPSP